MYVCDLLQVCKRVWVLEARTEMFWIDWIVIYAHIALSNV